MIRNVFLATAFGLAVAAPVNAATFSFSLATGLGSGSGSFTTVGNAASPELITSLTGTFGGNAMTLLAPGTYPGSAPNDNLFTTLAPYFSFGGVSFSAGGNNYNMYGSGGAVSFCGVTPGCGITTVRSFQVGAVPEPASWALMIIGFGAIGATMRYRLRGGVTA
jgi:hypothetical protein